jgi:transposase
VNLDELAGYDPSRGHEELAWESSEQLRYIPAHFVVILHKRQVLVYRTGEGELKIVCADGPAKVLGKSLPHETALAKIANDKYYLHQPLYRMEQAFAQLGYPLPRSTLCGWLMRMADLLEPIYRAMSADLRSGIKIHIDDTEVKVLEPGAGKAAVYRAWVLSGGAEGRRQVVFVSTPQRTSEAARELLSGYAGYLQADACRVYDGVYKSEQIMEVGCWSHAYRKFEDLKEVDRRVLPMREKIGGLYEVEERGRGISASERKELRQARAAPLLKQLRAWVEEQDRRELIESGFKKALRYVLNQWTALNRYLEHGALEIDNNSAESEFHVLGVGRRNYLFFGGEEGLRRGLRLFSLVRSCVAHWIDPYAYFVDVLRRIERHPARLVLELTPAYWKDLIIRETGNLPALRPDRDASPKKVPAVAAAP